MRSYKTEGIIIKRRNFGEADRMLTVFTKHGGKMQVKAVGVRRISSRRSSHVELLNLSILSLYQGRTLPILTEAQTIENFMEVKEDLRKVGFAYHICELVDSLCPENQENRSVFFLLEDTLRRLIDAKYVAPLVGEFEKSLLMRLGFYPHVSYAQNINTQAFIEQILERKLRSKDFLSRVI